MTSIDEELFRIINHAGENALSDGLMISFTFLATSVVVAAFCVPLWVNGRRELAFDLIVVVLLALLVTDLLKLAIDRQRPFETVQDVHILSWLPLPSDPSMPSGHASRAVAAATLLVISLDRAVVRSALLVFASGACISRIYLGVHWPSDVLAGAALGFCLGLLVHVLPLVSSVYDTSRRRAVTVISGRLRARAR